MADEDTHVGVTAAARRNPETVGNRVVAGRVDRTAADREPIIGPGGRGLTLQQSDRLACRRHSPGEGVDEAATGLQHRAVRLRRAGRTSDRQRDVRRYALGDVTADGAGRCDIPDAIRVDETVGAQELVGPRRIRTRALHGHKARRRGGGLAIEDHEPVAPVAAEQPTKDDHRVAGDDRVRLGVDRDRVNERRVSVVRGGARRSDRGDTDRCGQRSGAEIPGLHCEPPPEGQILHCTR